MSTMITEVYDALISAGADEDKAKKAAEAISSHDRRLTRIEFLIVGLYIAGGASLGYVINAISNNATLINTVISKLS